MYNNNNGGGNRAAMMMDKLEKEQEMVKALLPATVPHQSIKNWVTRQMVCVRFVDKIGHKKQKEKRVICLTPTTLFLCHIVGEVRRFIKMSQVESAIASHTTAGEQLLLKCSAPEHDVLINFTNDSRNDAKEKPLTFLTKLEKIKSLRGEFFPVDKRRGDLSPFANLNKHPKYVAPKKRMDKARHKQDDQYSENWEHDEATYIQDLGARAGRMGSSERPPPPPQHTTFMSSNSSPMEVPQDTFKSMSTYPLPKGSSPSPLPRTNDYSYTTGPASFNQATSSRGSSNSYGSPSNAAYNTVPVQAQRTYNAVPVQAHQRTYASQHADTPQVVQHSQPQVTVHRQGQGGYGQPAYTPEITVQSVQQAPHVVSSQKPHVVYSQTPHVTSGQQMHMSAVHSPVQQGYPQGHGGYAEAGGYKESPPRLQFHASSIPTAAEDMHRWNARNQAADVVGAPRPEDLGWVSAQRSPKPMPQQQEDMYMT
eukprot:TRINITY_DN1576_c1_g1_i1.p1 TRINITY_DN1576_c1_g1~~TRINITY_DN1576_c1_g1_i1.p1  ORF type:complete len:479 (+),score=84.26 TRINITY_DN1576_c1_g1_i1:84-1520(+)